MKLEKYFFKYLLTTALFLVLPFQMAHADIKKYQCDVKTPGLSHSLSVVEKEGALIKFDYLAISFVGREPPYPSCGIRATTEGQTAEDSIWKKTDKRYLIKFTTYLHDGDPDEVLIKSDKKGYQFDFSGVSPLSCGSSSGIAEKIIIRSGSKKCLVQKIRN